ncbi:hypothetical protein SAMN05877753_111146 [Bacillus oleivorans]|uniref:Large polyvalent protein associated domain-containing protein n=1 Tax=Bacillus oleivorans TaxID=1448271 RepID=A0A285D6A3_9BACI|nr:hypothetical protein [Bacillus oleivorans]SNX75309.1 hypothetical protein SAMN05877753_111146 [Bacillus oleivorans]
MAQRPTRLIDGGGQLNPFSRLQSKYQSNANKLFGGFTPYNPPSGSYYRDLGERAYQKKLEEEERKKAAKKAEKDNELYAKYGINVEGDSSTVKADDYFMEEEPIPYDAERNQSIDNDRFAGRYSVENSEAEQRIRKALSKKPKETEEEERGGLLGFLDRYLVPISTGATEVLFPGNNEAIAQNEIERDGEITNPITKAALKDRGLETDILQGTGTILGYTAPVSQGYKVGNVALNRLGALNRIQNPYGQRAIKGATAGTLTELGLSAENEFVNPEAGDLREYALRTGFGALGGGVFDPAVYGLGQVARRGLGSLRNSVDQYLPNQETMQSWANTLRPDANGNVPSNVLALPEPQLRLPGPTREAVPQPEEPPLQFRRTIQVEPTGGNNLNPFESISPNEQSLFQTQPRGFEAIRANREVAATREPNTTSNGFDPKEDLNKISGFRAATADVYRIFREAFGENYEQMGKPVIEKLDKAKKDYTDMQEKWLNKLETEVVKKLGIKKGSKDSALVQRYGEGNISLEELKRQAPNKWKDIVEADKWFRQAYDELHGTINQARQEIYPNDPDRLLPKLDNYYRHFRELSGLTGLRNIFDSPSQISPELAGLSQHTNPSSKFHGFMQRRGLGPYKDDAVGGFLEYIPNASYATNIDRVIPEFKNLRKDLVEGLGDDGSQNQFIEFLYNYSNDLAGKTNPYLDRNLQQLLDVAKIDGRKAMSVLNWVNNRVKKNVILGNVGSALAQLANIPNGIAFAKQHSLNGAYRAITSILDKNAPIHKSPFLKERYIDGMYRKFDTKWFEQPEKLAGWMISTSDRIGTSFIWNSAYTKGLKQGVPNPIKYADDNTRNLIAGRGVGEVPLLQKSKAFQFMMPFTLEVANLWHVMRDFVKAKDFGAIATLFLANFLLNKGMEETRGFGVTFDPIDATLDAVGDEELTNLQRVGRLGGEVLTNLPAGQFLANLYPEYGQIGNVTGLPTREQLFGERNPQRFGTGLLVQDAITDPIFKFALPFGGNQLKKTLEGAEALTNEGEYKKDSSLPFVGENEKLRFPIENPSLWNSSKGLLFGPSAFDEASEFYDNDRRLLSEKQTEDYEKLREYGKGKEFYDDLMKQREIATIERKIKEVDENEEMTHAEKQMEILRLLSKLQQYNQ